MIDRTAPIFVTGHRGMVGSAVVRRLSRAGFANILTASRQELDLRDQTAVDRWFDEHRPAYVIHAAGTVGGIHANSTRPAEFLYDNLMIHATVLHAGVAHGRRRSCLPRQLVHLSARLPAADPRGVPAHRPARADQRGLRHRQDRRAQVVRGLPPAVRLQFHLGDADEPVRAERQLRPDELARAAGADPQVSRVPRERRRARS